MLCNWQKLNTDEQANKFSFADVQRVEEDATENHNHLSQPNINTEGKKV